MEGVVGFCMNKCLICSIKCNTSFRITERTPTIPNVIIYIPVRLNIFNIGVLLLIDGQNAGTLPLGKHVYHHGP